MVQRRLHDLGELRAGALVSMTIGRGRQNHRSPLAEAFYTPIFVMWCSKFKSIVVFPCYGKTTIEDFIRTRQVHTLEVKVGLLIQFFCSGDVLLKFKALYSLAAEFDIGTPAERMTFMVVSKMWHHVIVNRESSEYKLDRVPCPLRP
eukprot:1466084-Amphidinium_carterae.2